MHFVTGGAFNGKRNWVKRQYPKAVWISAYCNDSLIHDLNHYDSPVIVLEGLETWVKDLSTDREGWRENVTFWLKWEQEVPGRKVVIIGSDITKGIVPMEKENRHWRDLTGWVYQDVAAVSKQVDVIWYGLPQTIKG